MNILFTICGRAGSKGFKNKNLKLLKGIPLVYYTLSAIRLYSQAHEEDRIVTAVNTDSKELKELIRRFGKISPLVFVDRKEEHAGDTVPKVEVIRDTYLCCKGKETFDVVVDLDITSPMRRVEDIEAILKEFHSKDTYDIVYSVVPSRRSPYFNMVEKKEEYYGKVCASTFTARQQVPKVYEMNASIYAYRPVFLEGKIEKTILDYRCGIVEMEDYLILDIDSEEDLEMMEILMDYYCDRDKELSKVMKESH